MGLTPRGRMKKDPESENEVAQLDEFRDAGRCRVTPMVHLSPSTAPEIVDKFTRMVRTAHATRYACEPNDDGIVRAQRFEEGDVYMVECPFDGYESDRYLMDFYNIRDRGVCSRMHIHTGTRMVRMMTGPQTEIRVSSLSPFEVDFVEGITPFMPRLMADLLPDDAGKRTRFNVVVPENSWLDVQIPRATSHQFNAVGDHAVIDSVHPEESVEMFRENMSDYKMLAQTIFLATERPNARACDL